MPACATPSVYAFRPFTNVSTDASCSFRRLSESTAAAMLAFFSRTVFCTSALA